MTHRRIFSSQESKREAVVGISILSKSECACFISKGKRRLPPALQIVLPLMPCRFMKRERLSFQRKLCQAAKYISRSSLGMRDSAAAAPSLPCFCLNVSKMRCSSMFFDIANSCSLFPQSSPYCFLRSRSREESRLRSSHKCSFKAPENCFLTILSARKAPDFPTLLNRCSSK